MQNTRGAGLAKPLTWTVCASLGASSAAAWAQSNARHTIDEICGDCRVEKVATCGGFLEGATFDADGKLWVVDLLSGNLLRVDGDQCTVEGNTGGQPNGAKFHRDRRLFVTDKNRGLLAFDPVTDEVTVVADTYRAERIRGTNDLVFDAEGGVYFTEPYGSSTLDPDGRVFYLPPGSNAALTVAVDGLAFPNGIALSADGSKLFVGEYANKRILSVPSPRSTNVFDVPYVFANIEGGVGPDGMTLDAAGNLYAAVFQAGEIRVLDPNGFAYGSIRLPEGAGTFVTNVAFHDGHLYITEGTNGEVWRVRVRHDGLPLFHQR